MKAEVSLIFPHQLFQDNPCLDPSREVVIHEKDLYFNQYMFHKMKLLYHRASMKHYEKWLNSQGYKIKYVECHQQGGNSSLMKALAENGVKEIHYVETVDFNLEKDLERLAAQLDISLHQYPSPQFLYPYQDFEDAIAAQGKKKYFLTNYYIHQRKKHGILLEDDQSPVGDKWTYDVENRKKMPKGEVTPGIPAIKEDSVIEEARKYVLKHFPNNPGEMDSLRYAITFDQARNSLDGFLQNRFAKYGVYQDAIDQREPFLYHSLISAPMNAGLLTPKEVIDTTLDFASHNEVPLNSLEGFIRQILGWREFFRGIYLKEGVKIRNSNFFDHHKKIPSSFYEGTTGIMPLDDMIKRVNKYCYAHHIERLMVAGNFMLLCEFDPHEVYRWFMELFIDAYDWVMVPNVYSMSQYADGGLLTTKPYISGSNYIHKMSHYPKGEWSEVWNALYWRFLKIHQDKLRSNPRMRMVYSLLNKMGDETVSNHLKLADGFLQKL